MKLKNSKIGSTLLPLVLLLMLSADIDAAQRAVHEDEFEEEDGRSPIGCKNMGYKFDLKTVELMSNSEQAKQSMYFFFNASRDDLSLYQMLGDESARSMYLNHKINARQWAVLSTSEKTMRYICTIPDKNYTYGKIVDCAEYLKVCEYNNVRYGLNNQGNYWLVNSNTRNGAVNAVVRYGIIPGV